MRYITGLIGPFCLLTSWLLASSVIGATLPDWAGAAFGSEASSLDPADSVSSRDLLALRDLGGLSLSPDGRWLAFSVLQAVPAHDDYVLRWFVAPSDGSHPPAPIDDGPSLPLITYGYGLPYTTMLNEPATWSPDSGSFAYRRRAGESVELWKADPMTRRASRVAGGGADVEAFAWLPSGHLAYRTGLNVQRYQENVVEEGRHGWLLDGRMPLFAAREPSPTRPDCGSRAVNAACEVVTYVSDKPDSSRRAAPSEMETFRQALERVAGKVHPDAALRVRGPQRADGRSVWAQVANPSDAGASAPILHVETSADDARPCSDPACTGAYIREVGWWREGRSIWFLKGESGEGRADGAPRDLTALYVWSPTIGQVRRVFRTEALVEDCHAQGTVAFCMNETIRQPRRIVAIDLVTGAIRPLADPNPGFAAKAFPRVVKLQLHDDEGNPAFAHVVYPYGYQRGRRYPLVVTQYSSKGFLRGQVGGVFPIYPLAAEGFVVLSVDRPEDWTARLHLSHPAVLARGVSDDLRDRRSTFSVNETAVDQLIAEGLVDPERMALTGLSAGAENVHYTLQRTDRYVAAIADSGVHDLTFFAQAPPGPTREALMAWFSSDHLIPPPGNAIHHLAWSEQPERLHTPLLINTGANQALLGFEGLQSLIQAGRPLEVRMFPGEMHIVYHPCTLAAIRENNMAWLKFWLLGAEDPRPEMAAQNRRWRAMRERVRLAAKGAASNPSGAPHSGQ